MQKRQTIALFVLLLAFGGALSACANLSSATVRTVDEDAPTQTLVSADIPARNASAFLAKTATPLPTPSPAPEQRTIRVWWPDELYPPEGSAAAEILQSQFELFRQTYSSYTVEIRRKRSHGLGGILSSLRTAAPVAPGALPDLTLMRREDLLTAAQEGLIVPLEGWMPANLSGSNLFSGVRALGEVDGVLYGIPYVLDAQHTLYRASVFQTPPQTFEDVLQAETPYLFAADDAPVSWTVLLQYLAADGQLVDANGAATLSPDALQTVLEFYAEGEAVGVFSPALLDYTQPQDYWNVFVSGEAHLITIDTHAYLSQREAVQNVAPSVIPTADGTSLTVLDGWMWVVTTPNPDHQRQALAFLSWMMRVSHQSAFSEAFGVLPSQVRALRLWEDRAYADFAQTLITTAVVFPEVRRNNVAAVALQNAVVDVIKGVPPQTALDEALESLAS